jgi:CheY-like chemotaxis protein
LDPYVCLFERCDSAEELHTHSSPWLKHMREHTLKWKCISKSHEPFVTQVRSQYLEHMRLAHTGKFSEAQLDVLADRTGARMTGPMFPSCPLCSIRREDLEQVSMENHVVGHLRHLALKSLPAYEESVDDDDDSDLTSVATSRPETRSTIRNYTEDSDLTRQNLNSKSNALEDIYTESWLPIVIADDASNVEQTPSDGIAPKERRYYEWPFLAEKEANSVNPQQDPTLAAFAMRWYRESRGEETGSKSTHEGEEPISCTICGGKNPKVLCKCEIRVFEDPAFDTAVRQAEGRMLRSVYSEIRTWVRAHGQDHVLEVFRSHLEQGAQEQKPEPKAGPSAETPQSDPTRKREGGSRARAGLAKRLRPSILSRPTVLIAKNDLIDREFLTSMLQLESIHQVTVAKDGQQAFDLVKKAMDEDKPFDLIFMSAEMPNLDGLESAKLMRGIGCNTPIVAVGFFFSETEIQQCRDAGMEYYLSKPVRRPALRQILNDLTAVPDEKPPDSETATAYQQEDVDEAWVTAYQSYPEALDYYFGLVELTLPADDDKSVVDPPLSVLRPRPPYRGGGWRPPTRSSTRRDYSESDDEVSADGSYPSDSPPYRSNGPSGAFIGSQALRKSSGSYIVDPDEDTIVNQAESRSGVKQVRFHRDAEWLEIDHDDGDDKADNFWRGPDAEGDKGAAEKVQFDDSRAKFTYEEDRNVQNTSPTVYMDFTNLVQRLEEDIQARQHALRERYHAGGHRYYADEDAIQIRVRDKRKEPVSKHEDEPVDPDQSEVQHQVEDQLPWIR